MADGSRRKLKYIKEVTFGTIPALPAMTEIRNTGGAGIKYDRSMLQSNEMRADRAIADVTQGNKKPALDIPFEMSAASFDDFLEAVLGGTWTVNVLKCGLVLGSFSIEEAFEDIASFTLMIGAKINTLSLDIKPDSIITGSFGLLGKSVASPTGVTAADSEVPANSNNVFNSFTGSIKEGGATIAIITGLSLNLTNNLTPEYVVLQDEASGIGAGRVQVTGEISVYFPDDTLLGKYIAGTESSLEFTLGDVAGNTYTFLMSKVKYTSESKNIPEGSIIQTLGFMALHDVTNTTLEITRVVI
jgi:tail tube protein